MEFWQGKFNEGQSPEITRYLSTYSFDKRLYKHDVMGSIAHCTMLGEQGVITPEEASILRTALTQIFYDVTSGKLVAENETSVFDFLDESLSEKVGEIGKKINVARTPADRFALDMRMYAVETYTEVANSLKTIAETFIGIAEQNYATIMPSYYCGVKSQPTTLAHTLMAFAETAIRDAERFIDAKKRVAVMPLYSAYGTGVRYNVNRKRVAELLKLPAVTQNSLDAITDVDYIGEFVAIANAVAGHVAKIANTYIDWNKSDFLRVDSTVNVDSAIVPSVSVPTVFETLVARAAKIANISSIFNVSASAYYSQSVYEYAETFFNTEALVRSSLDALEFVIPSCGYNEQTMLKVATADFSVAKDCVDYLIDKGADIDDAYDTVGKLCKYCAEAGKRLDTIDDEIYAGASVLFDTDIVSAMRLKNATRLRKHDGEPGEVAVRAEIRALQRKIKKLFD